MYRVRTAGTRVTALVHNRCTININLLSQRIKVFSINSILTCFAMQAKWNRPLRTLWAHRESDLSRLHLWLRRVFRFTNWAYWDVRAGETIPISLISIVHCFLCSGRRAPFNWIPLSKYRCNIQSERKERKKLKPSHSERILKVFIPWIASN